MRTAAPVIRKLKFGPEGFEFDMTWLGTATAAFISSWFVIVSIIPLGLDPLGRVLAAFLIAFAGNSIFNEAVKWKPVMNYIKTGEKPNGE